MKRIKLVTPVLYAGADGYWTNIFAWACEEEADKILGIPKDLAQIRVTVTNYKRPNAVRIVITEATKFRSEWVINGEELYVLAVTQKFLEPFFGVKSQATLYVTWEKVE